jgi:hypothetical protein
MTPLDAGRTYAVRGWVVFPFGWRGPRRKRPLTPNGFLNASTDPIVIDTLNRPLAPGSKSKDKIAERRR